MSEWKSDWIPDRGLDLWEINFRESGDPNQLDYVELQDDLDNWLDLSKPEDAARAEEVKRLLALMPAGWEPQPSEHPERAARIEHWRSKQK